MLAAKRHTGTRTEKLGSTWVGATSPCRAVASADAALVAPTHVLEAYRIRTVPVRTEYQNRSRSRTDLRPDAVPSLDLIRYLNRTEISTEISTDTGRDCGERGNHR